MSSNLVARKRKEATVDVPDVERVFSLFVDVGRSTTYLTKFQEEFMFSHKDSDKHEESMQMVE